MSRQIHARSNPFAGKPIHQIQHTIINDMKLYFERNMMNGMPDKFFNLYSPFPASDPDRKKFQEIFANMINYKNYNPQFLGLTPCQSRGLAAVLGMAVCDALGACTEFEEYNHEGYGYIKNGFSDIQECIKRRYLKSRHGKITIWTDDASMGFAMAYSLLHKNYEFDPKHMRYMFQLWWSHGLGNGGRVHSIGLGGNIKISMEEFCENQTDFAEKGKQNNSGNGSLMRLAPIAVAFSDNMKKAMSMSELSSLTTHNGLEAKECCRLMAAIIVALIKREEDEKLSKDAKRSNWKQLIEKICHQFKSEIDSVKYLAQSMQQPEDLYVKQCNTIKGFSIYNAKLSDRNWNWKDESFRYSSTRNQQQPGYIGSYCMDALAMALHTVWHTKSFKECALMNTNMGGDCDSVGSIAGQIAGAIYGVTEDMLKLYSEMEDFTSKRFEAFLIGYKMINKKNLKGNVVVMGESKKEGSKMEIE